MRACSRTRSRALALVRSSGGVTGSGSSPSASRVATPRSTRRVALTAGDAGDQAQVVVVPTTLCTDHPPAADVAMVDRLGIRGGRVDRGRSLWPDRGVEAGAGGPVVGHVVGHPERPEATGGTAQDDVERGGLDALDGGQHVHVHADLEHGGRFDVASELGVRDLVVIWAPSARPIRVVHPKQEVRVAAPGAIEERGLVDDVRSGSHRPLRLGRGRPQLLAAILDRSVERDLDHRSALAGELRQVATLVLLAAPAQDVQLRIGHMRALREARQNGPFERGQVLALEIADQVGRRVDGRSVDQLHRRIVG